MSVVLRLIVQGQLTRAGQAVQGPSSNQLPSPDGLAAKTEELLYICPGVFGGPSRYMPGIWPGRCRYIQGRTVPAVTVAAFGRRATMSRDELLRYCCPHTLSAQGFITDARVLSAR